MIAARFSLLVIYAALLPYLALGAPHALPTQTLQERGILRALVRFNKSTIGTWINSAATAFNTLDIVDTVIGLFKGEDKVTVAAAPVASAAAQAVTKRSVHRRQNETSSDDAEDSETLFPDDGDDTETLLPSQESCSIDKDAMLAAAQDAQSRAATLMTLSSDSDYQSAVTAFNQTLEPIFDGINLLNIGEVLGDGSRFVPSPAMGQQFVSFINDAKSALDQVSAPTADINAEVQGIEIDLKKASTTATEDCQDTTF